MMLILSMVLAVDGIGTARDFPLQDDPRAVTRYFVDAASAGDYETAFALVDLETLKQNRKNETPRTVLNAYLARLVRAACFSAPGAKTNQWKDANKELVAVRLSCSGRVEDLTMRKVGSSWRVIVPDGVFGAL